MVTYKPKSELPTHDKTNYNNHFRSNNNNNKEKKKKEMNNYKPGEAKFVVEVVRAMAVTSNTSSPFLSLLTVYPMGVFDQEGNAVTTVSLVMTIPFLLIWRGEVKNRGGEKNFKRDKPTPYWSKRFIVFCEKQK